MGRRSREVSRKKLYSEDHHGWTFHPISLSSIGTYSVSWRTDCASPAASYVALLYPPGRRIRAARRCAAGSPTDSSLMEPVNTARGHVMFSKWNPENLLWKLSASPPPSPPPLSPFIPEGDIFPAIITLNRTTIVIGQLYRNTNREHFAMTSRRYAIDDWH